MSTVNGAYKVLGPGRTPYYGGAGVWPYRKWLEVTGELVAGAYAAARMVARSSAYAAAYAAAESTAARPAAARAAAERDWQTSRLMQYLHEGAR